MTSARVTASLCAALAIGIGGALLLNNPAIGQPAPSDPAVKPAKVNEPPRVNLQRFKQQPVELGIDLLPDGKKDGTIARPRRPVPAERFIVRQPRRSTGFAREAPAPAALKIYKLKHAQADHIVDLLQRLFHDEVMVADDRTNQIIIRTKRATEVDQVINALDVPGAKKRAIGIGEEKLGQPEEKPAPIEGSTLPEELPNPLPESR